ncbi:MAG: 8-oxoguanine DNA glycosylase [Clostridia bacterium]|nr:8-oxoguanine DNA glycosylase [Clostridia bacterium]
MILKDFDLREIAYSGQCFRFTENPDSSFTFVVGDKIYTMKQEGDDVSGFSSDLSHYFDLETDYGNIKKKLSEDPVLSDAIRSCPGMRILNQDFFETLISFIISQNNNIPRIKGLIKKISEKYGKEIENGIYSFPDPVTLSRCKAEELMELKLGYRAEYIAETAKRYVELGYHLEEDPKKKFLEDAEKSGITPVEHLMSFKGVGPKVANCVALFGLHLVDAFPIDVWVKRVMNRLYGIPENNRREMEKFAEENFSPYSGIAQQYLFFHIRNMEEIS